MEIYRLDDSTYLPVDPIEGWKTLIWTDRYAEAGEFQLKTPNIAETLTAIPDGSLVCEKDSPEVMYVETHSISTSDDGEEELTVKGRTFETNLERRIMRGEYRVPWSMGELASFTIQDAIAVIIWNAVVNPTTADVTGSPNTRTTFENYTNVDVSRDIRIQNVATGQVDDLITTQEWWLDQSEVYAKVLSLLVLGNLGIRTVRPISHNADILSVAYSGGVTPVPIATWTPTDPVTSLRYEIYNGQRRTVTPAAVDPLMPVIFADSAGHLQTPSYLWSLRGMKNYAWVDSNWESGVTWDGESAGASEPTNEDRYETYVDVGQIDVEITDTAGYLKQKGQEELKKLNRQILLDAAVSPKLPYKYNEDYFLGDVITAIGKYGVAQDMRVVEYVRTHDENGERGYPTLIVNK